MRSILDEYSMLKYIVTYFLIINLIGFIFMGVDKSRAKTKSLRIKEKTLFFVAIIGGSIGSILGMYYFHHKTKHKNFVYGMPSILGVQLCVIILIYKFFIFG